MRSLTKQTCFVAVALLLASCTLSSALSYAGRTCASTNPIAAVDLSTGAYAECVKERCIATTGAAPTAPSADGQCDGSGTAEAASTATCSAITQAFSTYYACVLRAMREDASAPAEARNAYELYDRTPGVPYSVSAMPCYSCVNFDATFARTAFPADCSADATCDKCCGQDPTTNRIGEPGKGYNHVLCGNGCVTGLMMTAFALLSAFIFGACGLCWPSPSLKATVERLRREEEEEKARALAAVSSDDDYNNNRQPQRINTSTAAVDGPDTNHEPAGDEEYPTEPQAADHQPVPTDDASKSSNGKKL